MMDLFCGTARAAFASRAALMTCLGGLPGRVILSLVAVGLAASPGLVSPAVAASPQPHELTYRALADTALRLEMDAGSQSLGAIRRGTGGIRLHWCEPAIPYQAWANATPDAQRALLDARWCEVEANGVVGNVDGRMLSPG